MTQYKIYETYRTSTGELRYRGRIHAEGKRHSRSFSTLSDLKLWLGKMEKMKRDIRVGEESYLPTDFGAASRRWFTEHVDIYMAPSMRICNREIFAAQFMPPMGTRDMAEIKADEWETLLATLAIERKWAAATFNRRRALLMSFYNWCVDKEITPQNPLKRIRKRREAEKQPRFLNANELQMFLEVCEVAPHAICFYILANTGMRVSEALGLRWCDVDLGGGWIRIGRIFCKATGRIEERTKGGQTRMIGMNAALKELLLMERQRGYATDSQSLIVAMPGGKSPGLARLRSVFEKNLRGARLTHHGIHDLRHSFASVFMMSGGSLWDLKTILGHSTIDLTERYSHFSPQHLRQQSEQVSFGATKRAEVLPLHRSLKPVCDSLPNFAHDDFKIVNK